MLAPKDVSKRLFTDPLPTMPLEEGQEHVYSLYTKSGDVVSHNSTTTPSPPQHFHIVGICTPGGGHKELSDCVAELTLELKSVKDDYDTLCCGLGVKIECLEKRVEKGNH